MFKFQVMIYIFHRKKQFHKIIPHQLDELFVQEEKRKILILSSGWLNGESFVLKSCGDLTINYSSQFGHLGRGRQWNIETRLSLTSSLGVSWDHDYCRTSEPLWLQGDDNDSSGVISALSRDGTTRSGRFGHLLENNFQSRSVPPGHSSHLCRYCLSRRNNIL